MQNDEFFKVRINSLSPDKKISFDLFLKVGAQIVLYMHAGDKIDKEKLKNLETKDTGNTFLVKEEDRSAYKNYVHDQMVSDDLNVREKANVLRESSMTLVEELYENPDVSVALEGSKPLIKEFVTFMNAEPEAMAHLISLSGHDFYTYNHSLDVSIYSLGLAQALGFTPAELEELGLGSLFHDLGKRQVHLDILCKKGPLDPAEWTQMQKHPEYGLAILNDQKNISDAVKAACFEHHESCAGNGYPQSLSAAEIHPFAKIVAITDTYDAMTTQRSYNVPLTPEAAVTMMVEKLKVRYDAEMLRVLQSVLFKLHGRE